MDQAPSGRDHDPTKKGEHLEDPMMVTMDAKTRADQEAELKAMFAYLQSVKPVSNAVPPRIPIERLTADR